jgi:hypothetical protein
VRVEGDGIMHEQDACISRGSASVHNARRKLCNQSPTVQGAKQRHQVVPTRIVGSNTFNVLHAYITCSRTQSVSLAVLSSNCHAIVARGLRHAHLHNSSCCRR